MKNIIFLCSFLLLSSCAGIKPASEAQNSEAKLFKAVAKKGVLYIFRDEGLGGALHKSIRVNGTMLGETGPDSFFRYVVEPGTCKIDSNGESVLEVSVKAGQIYYVWQEMKMGVFSGSTKLSLVDANRGRKGVLDSRLIQNP